MQQRRGQGVRPEGRTAARRTRKNATPGQATRETAASPTTGSGTRGWTDTRKEDLKEGRGVFSNAEVDHNTRKEDLKEGRGAARAVAAMARNEATARGRPR